MWITSILILSQELLCLDVFFLPSLLLSSVQSALQGSVFVEKMFHS